MKICTNCNTEFPDGKYCLECGGKLIERATLSKETKSGVTLGDKNVVAGDVIGQKEEYKITGSATIIKNDDETRRVVNCSVCGKTMKIIDSVRCLSCVSYVCNDHFDWETERCSDCDKRAETDYRNFVMQILEDGKIDRDERISLDSKAKLLKVSSQRADDIENDLKTRPKGINGQSLSTVDKIEFKKIRKEITTLSDLAKTFESIERLYRKYPDNDEIKRRYCQLGPYAIGTGFTDNLSRNFDDFHTESARMDLEILCNKDLHEANSILDQVKEKFPERELDVKAKELDILYRFYETEGDEYVEAIEELLKDIIAQGWHDSDYAGYILFKIFTDKKITFSDEVLNDWGKNLTNMSFEENTLVQIHLFLTPQFKISSYPNGDIYEGYVIYGKRHGKGKLTYSPSDENKRKVYDGEWKEDKRSGQGVLIWEDGKKYDGKWKEDQINGKGAMTYQNGGKYDGEWEAGRWHGKGAYIFSSGQQKYIGEFKNGNYDGKGVMTYPDGDKYDGEWKHDKKNGKGVYTFPSGQKYEGDFKDGKYDGKGVLTYPDGSKYAGEWKDDKKNGNGVYTWPCGQKYEGDFKDDNYDGKGVLTYAPSDECERKLYDGEWKDDNKNGRGIMIWLDGNKYVGDWKDGMRNGIGVMTSPGGDEIEGYWENDTFMG